MKYKRTCIYCKEEFFATYINRKACSQKCRIKFKIYGTDQYSRIKNIDLNQFYDIPNYEGLYKIDIHGNVVSLISMKIIKQNIRGKSYLGVTLCKNNIHKPFYIHRLIALTFISNPKNKPHINHIDGNKLNNELNNLEWVTSKENINHSYKIGTSKVGESRHDSKLTNKQVFEIRRRHDFGFSNKEIAKYMGINGYFVQSVINCRNYKTINESVEH